MFYFENIPLMVKDILQFVFIYSIAKAPVASVPGIEPGQALNGPPTGNRFTMQRGRGQMSVL